MLPDYANPICELSDDKKYLDDFEKIQMENSLILLEDFKFESDLKQYKKTYKGLNISKDHSLETLAKNFIFCRMIFSARVLDYFNKSKSIKDVNILRERIDKLNKYLKIQKIFKKLFDCLNKILNLDNKEQCEIDLFWTLTPYKESITYFTSVILSKFVVDKEDGLFDFIETDDFEEI